MAAQLGFVPLFIFLVLTVLCAPPLAQADSSATDLIFASDGRELTRSELLAELAHADFILLGEHHDNTFHHMLRAQLISALASRKPTIVMEYLHRGEQLHAAAPLLDELQRTQFNLNGWRWPAHEPLFTAARSAGLTILGGNLSRSDARRIALEGEKALEAPLAAVISQTALSLPAQEKLDADLNAGHCGHLPAPRLPAMRLAQRARDAAMASTLRAVPQGPVILLAGNGHVRRDYGVAQLLRVLEPTRRSISIGFYEANANQLHEPQHALALRDSFDYLWLTSAVKRDDPCVGFSLPPVK